MSLSELRSELLQATIESDNIKTTELDKEYIKDIVKASIESSVEATEYLTHQIMKNAEFLEKFGVKATLEYYDFTEDEIRVALEKYNDDEVVHIINNKFIDKIGKFFKNIIKAILTGIKKFFRWLINPPFLNIVKDTIEELESKGYVLPKDTELKPSDVKKYINDHKDELKVAVIKNAKTLSGAQFKIISDYYSTGKSLEFLAELLDSISTTSVLLNAALARYATGRISDRSEIERAVKLALSSTLKTVDFIKKYDNKIPYYKEWLSLPEVNRYAKDNVVVLPYGVDGKNVKILRLQFNDVAYSNLENVSKLDIDEVAKLLINLDNLWFMDVVNIPLKSIKVDPSKLVPKIMTIDEMHDIVDKYTKVAKYMNYGLNEIHDKLSDIINHDEQSKNFYRGEFYDLNVEKIIAALFNYRVKAFNQVYSVIDAPLEEIVYGYFNKLPVVIDYLEMIKEYYVIEE